MEATVFYLLMPQNYINSENVNLSVFEMIIRINESKKQYKKTIYHANVNTNLMVENVIQIRSGITVNVDVSVKI